MENDKTWMLIADASKARIYSCFKARIFNEPHNPNNLSLINTYEHAESRKKDSELMTDKLGEFGSGTFVEFTSPKQHEADLFAQELIHHLKSGKTAGHFHDLIIVAPPAFLGLLQKHMPHDIQKLVIKTIEKDYTQQDPLTLLKNLLNHL